MQQFTAPSHLVALIATAVGIAVLIPLARLRPGRWVTFFSWLLAAFLVGVEVAYQLVNIHEGMWSAAQNLPLYVCDVAAFVGAAALIWPKPVLVEVTWFWALGGALQGSLTPDHVISFPSFDWLSFYGNHMGLIVAAFFLVIGRRLHPQRWAALRVIAITVVFIVLVGITDALTGGNYNYLRVPAPGSVMSLLGPWPWYVLGTTAVGVVVIALLDLPFWAERRNRHRLPTQF